MTTNAPAPLPMCRCYEPCLGANPTPVKLTRERPGGFGEDYLLHCRNRHCPASTPWLSTPEAAAECWRGMCARNDPAGGGE
jgi:hypothetical protein